MPAAATNSLGPLGPLSYNEDQVLHMVGGLVGFPDVTRFVLLENPEIDPLRWLVSIENTELSLAVIDPRLLVADFHVRLSNEQRHRLELTSETEILPLAITLLAERAEDATANLKAPIIVNTAKMLAAQVVLNDASPYSIRHPLLGEKGS